MTLARIGYALSALALVAGVVAAATLSSRAVAGPEPAPVPKRWQLDVAFGPLNLTTVETPDTGRRAYFYLTYRVTNNTGQDLLFAPSFHLTANSGRTYRSGRDVPVAVTRSIMERLENPFLVDEITMTDTLLQGKQNSREGVVIWPAYELKTDTVTIYGAGFSGETATIEVPKAGSRELTKYVLRKTAEMVYHAGGELDPAIEPSLEPQSRRWIMR